MSDSISNFLSNMTASTAKAITPEAAPTLSAATTADSTTDPNEATPAATPPQTPAPAAIPAQTPPQAIDPNTSTPAIDNNINNAANFVIGMSKNIITLGILVLVGACVLYSCRVAQSNILPTDINCFPFTDTLGDKPAEIGIDINIMYDSSSQQKVSEKIKFPFDENILLVKGNPGNYIIKYLKWISKPGTFSFSEYILKTCKDSIVNSIFLFDGFYTLLNSILPESFIFVFGLFLVMFVAMFIFIINIFYCFYLWIVNYFTILFKGGLFENAGSKLMMFIIFLFVFPFILVLTPILSLWNVIISFFFPLTMKAKKGEEKYSFFIIFHVTFYYKKNIILSLFSLMFLSITNSIYGVLAVSIGILVCLFLYFFTPIFQNVTPGAGFTPMGTSFEKAAKEACPIPEEKHSIMGGKKKKSNK